MLELMVQTAKGSRDDRISGLAAEIAFWVLLSLPPLLLVAASAAGLIGQGLGTDVRVQLIARIEELALQVFTRPTVEASITPILDTLLESGSPSVLSLSFLVTIYSVSRILRVVVHAVTIAYLDVARPRWIARVKGIVFTLVGLVFGLVLIPLVVAGPRLGEIIEDRLGLNLLLTEAWRLAYWPVSFVGVTLMLAVLYHYAVPWGTPFRRELPGAVLATTVGLVLSVGLRAYTTYAFEGDGVYATLAAPLALLLWLWLQSIALLVGAELNAAIERTYPVGRAAPDPPSLAEIGRSAVERVRNLGTPANGTPVAEETARSRD